MSGSLGLFGGRDRPDVASAWKLYEESERFNSAIDLYDTVRVNENFYIGKQWEGVRSNGLPTPQFNFLKRVVGFIVATITTDDVKVTATPLAATAGTEALIEPARIVNEEFEAITERNNIPSLLREYARNAAVDGDGCLYSWWDPDMETGQEARGGIRTEVIENTRVRFGNPNDRQVQSQPWILITRQSMVREAKLRARENGMADWDAIQPDGEEQSMDAVKRCGDKVTELLLLWREEDSGEIWAFETTRYCALREPYSTGVRLYPLCWLNWDYVADCYHGQAMITGLIPNQIFVNKIWAAVMLANQRGAFPKVIYDKTRIKNWDNRVGAAIGVSGGDVSTVARNMDGSSVSPQIPKILELAVEMTEQSLGATSVALGDTRPDNTSAIIALQRAAATPSEMTKQNLYAGLYGQDTANNMAALWKAQNPDLAYNTGRMTAEEYKAVTGKYPKGYTAPRSGGAAVRDPYGMGSLSDAQRSTQIRGLLESLNKGDASARAKALNYISANEAYFTDNELNNFTSALEKGMRLAGYNL